MLDHDELGIETIQKYIELRKAKKLGPIWLSGQVITFSDVDDILSRRVLPLGEYKKLISYWYPTNQKEVETRELTKIGPKRESRITSNWNRRYY